MIQDRFNTLGETIELRKAGKTEEAKQIILSDRGKIAMDNIRILITEIEKWSRYLGR